MSKQAFRKALANEYAKQALEDSSRVVFHRQCRARHIGAYGDALTINMHEHFARALELRMVLNADACIKALCLTDSQILPLAIGQLV